ncbi:MAG: family 20 glycosylhydrolase [Bacteroidota bacterium]
MRHKILTIIFLLFAGCILHAQTQLSIIPKPVEINQAPGFFTIDPQVSLQIAADQVALKPAADFFVGAVNDISGIKIPVNKTSRKKITLSVVKNFPLNNEGYYLTVTPAAVKITAKSYAGIFYGLQSLLQTFPQVRTNAVLQVPCMEIRDEPRFKWRGMHLDVSRHFFSPAVIKNYIDLMAMYKLNTFHLHLVDDQGWRIEIKKYPALTATGAWRVDQTSLPWGARPQAKPGEQPSYGGYYTQEQVKEIVAYAQKRNITVVPEIEMPGHVASAIASYPNLSCNEKPQLTITGGNYTDMSSNYCAGKDEVFGFLEDVLTEVMAIFPSSFIHIGGDEVDKGPWKACPRCQARMKKEGLKNEDELQSYFMKRIEKFIVSKKRKMIGWDEILEGGLAPEAAVMSWRGEAGGIEAAKMNHEVVMTPGNPYYFDHYQAGPEGEPLAIGGFNTLKKVYDYDPVPKELATEKHKYILGAQANVWTEYISTTEHLEYMVLPRMLALAETVWSPASGKNWEDFNRRLKYHFTAFEQKGLHYSPGNFTVDIMPISSGGKTEVELFSEMPTAKIYYTLDGTLPSSSSTLYERPIPVNASMLVKAVTVQNSTVMNPRPAEQAFIMHKALGKDVKYETPYSRYYPANGPNSLTDGIRGKNGIGKFWHGFSGTNLVATVDLGSVTDVSRITIGCIQNYSDWVFLPTAVKFEVSEDGQNFSEVGVQENSIPATQKGVTRKDFAINISPAKTRFIKVTAKVLPACPPGHPGAGKPAWVFADELIVE